MMMFIDFIFVSLLTTQVFSYGLNNRITNAYVSGIGQFPHQVELVRSNVWGMPDQLEQRAYCGGSIINESWILTAAYCVYKISLPSQVEVLAGAYDLDKTSEAHRQSRSVSKIHIHSSYPGLHSQHDIALLELSEPLIIHKNVHAISLPSENEYHSGVGTVSGWGSTSTTDIVNMPNILHYGSATIVDFNECKRLMKKVSAHLEIFNTQLCTGFNAGVTTCIGDSGNPLIQKNYNTWEQIGIVSWGLYPCGDSKISSVYTSVSHYIDWINDIVSTKKN